jgi:hypothetical protein
MFLVYNQVQIYAFILNGTNKNLKNYLSSESQRLLLLGEVEVFGHFVEEGIGPKTVEVEDGEGINPGFDGRGEEDSFVGDVLLDLVEIVF